MDNCEEKKETEGTDVFSECMNDVLRPVVQVMIDKCQLATSQHYEGKQVEKNNEIVKLREEVRRMTIQLNDNERGTEALRGRLAYRNYKHTLKFHFARILSSWRRLAQRQKMDRLSVQSSQSRRNSKV